jgi:hypothetical protein
MKTAETVVQPMQQLQLMEILTRPRKTVTAEDK